MAACRAGRCRLGRRAAADLDERLVRQAVQQLRLPALVEGDPLLGRELQDRPADVLLAHEGQDGPGPGRRLPQGVLLDAGAVRPHRHHGADLRRERPACGRPRAPVLGEQLMVVVGPAGVLGPPVRGRRELQAVDPRAPRVGLRQLPGDAVGAGAPRHGPLHQLQGPPGPRGAVRRRARPAPGAGGEGQLEVGGPGLAHGGERGAAGPAVPPPALLHPVVPAGGDFSTVPGGSWSTRSGRYLSAHSRNTPSSGAAARNPCQSSSGRSGSAPPTASPAPSPPAPAGRRTSSAGSSRAGPPRRGRPCRRRAAG